MCLLLLLLLTHQTRHDSHCVAVESVWVKISGDEDGNALQVTIKGELVADLKDTIVERFKLKCSPADVQVSRSNQQLANNRAKLAEALAGYDDEVLTVTVTDRGKGTYQTSTKVR